MARNKKPRKKYTAPHNLLASSGIYAGDIARLSVKKTGLDERTRDIAIKPFRVFIAELKKGMADVQMYCDAYTRFISSTMNSSVFCCKQISAPIIRLKCCLERRRLYAGKNAFWR